MRILRVRLRFFISRAEGCFVSKQTQPYRHPTVGRPSILGYVRSARRGRLYICSKTEQWEQSDWRMRIAMAPTWHSTQCTARMGNSSEALASFPDAIRKAHKNLLDNVMPQTPEMSSCSEDEHHGQGVQSGMLPRGENMHASRSYRSKDHPCCQQYDQNDHRNPRNRPDFIPLVVHAEASGARLT